MCPSACGRPPNPRRRLAAFLTLLAALWQADPYVRADSPAESSGSGFSIGQVRVGFGGLYKVGRWTPIAVEIRADRPGRMHWSIEVPDPHGSPTVISGPVVEFQQAGVQTVETVFRTGRLQGHLRLRIDGDAHRVRFDSGEPAAKRLLRSGDESGESLLPALEQSAVLVAAWGGSGGLNDLPAMVRPVHIVELDDAAELPSNSIGYEGLDVLFLNGNPPLTRRQSEAIRDWVRGGGHLAVAVGRDAPAFQQGALYGWLGESIPVSGRSRLTKIDVSGLEEFAGQREQIVLQDRQWRAVIGGGGTADSPFRGQTLVPTGAGEPLIAAIPYRFGKVTFFGIDLDQSPIANWNPLPKVLHSLVFEEFPIQSTEHVEGARRLSSSGVSDLATQLLSALEHFPELRPVTTWTVMTLFLVYLAIIGPADYFLVHRLLRKPSITWVSFPAIVVLAAACAFWTARTANSGEARLNQIDLIDVDAASGAEQFARTSSWMTLYSPDTQRNRVTVAPRLGGEKRADPRTDGGPTSPFRLSWAGTPESSFGGMYRSGGIEFGRAAYHYAADAGEIEDLPTLIWSTANFSASNRQALSENIVESNLSSPAFGALSGTLTHHFPGPLKDWMIAYGPSVYRPSEDSSSSEAAAIEPGAVWSTDDPNVSPQELLSYLTRSRLKEIRRTVARPNRTAEYRLAQTEYDPFNRRPSEILRMITFYRRVGGEKYTKLDNDALRRLDLSTLLELNRAVLFARIDEPAADYSINSRPSQAATRSTFVRIVLPVHQTRRAD